MTEQSKEAREGEAVGWLWRSQGGTIKLTTWHPDTQAESAERLYIHPAAPSADKLREFGQHTNLELSYGHGDEVEDGSWRVHRVNGGVNDREWTLIGSGATPADAIDQALAAMQAEGA